MDMTVHVMANSLLYWTQSLYNEGLLKPIIIMGRKTWDSLPIKPLPNRINIILSKLLDPNEIENAYIFSNWNKHC